ncbi:MAG: FG-GAP repeat protein, partial [Actinomycetota bacterium]
MTRIRIVVLAAIAALVLSPVSSPAVQQAKLVALDPSNGDLFGVASAISGDTAVIGASQDDHALGSNAGSAYVFTRLGDQWTQQQRLFAADAASNRNFGVSVAVSGDTAVVGSNLDDPSGPDSGSAYVFVRTVGVWAQQAKLVATDAAGNDQFGASVAIAGDTILVGANSDDLGLNADAGSAYVFTRTGTVWT